MDRANLPGAVLAIDHDRLFKELLTTFFVEFLELFFPKNLLGNKGSKTNISDVECSCGQRG